VGTDVKNTCVTHTSTFVLELRPGHLFGATPTTTNAHTPAHAMRAYATVQDFVAMKMNAKYVESCASIVKAVVYRTPTRLPDVRSPDHDCPLKKSHQKSL